MGNPDPLMPNQPYAWPNAPRKAGGSLDLRYYPEEHICYGATTLLEPEEDYGFTAVSNPKLGLVLIYVFPAEIFPWTSLWFEHQASEFLPYKGKTTTWGVEFGSCAMALKLMETLNAVPLFGVPRTGTLPAKHTIEVNYQAQLLKIPPDWQGVERIALARPSSGRSGPGDAQKHLQPGESRPRPRRPLQMLVDCFSSQAL